MAARDECMEIMMGDSANSLDTVGGAGIVVGLNRGIVLLELLKLQEK